MACLNFSGNLISAAILISFSEIIGKLAFLKVLGRHSWAYVFNLLSPYSKPNWTYHFLMIY